MTYFITHFIGLSSSVFFFVYFIFLAQIPYISFYLTQIMIIVKTYIIQPSAADLLLHVYLQDTTNLFLLVAHINHYGNFITGPSIAFFYIITKNSLIFPFRTHYCVNFVNSPFSFIVSHDCLLNHCLVVSIDTDLLYLQ